MIIATANLRGSASAHQALIRSELQALNCDVLCLQEASSSFAATLGAHVVGEQIPGSRWGTIIVTRKPTADTLVPKGFEGWVFGAVLTMPRPLLIVNVHTPSVRGRSYVRLVEDLIDWIATVHNGREVVLAGDLNIATAHRLPGETVRMTRGEQNVLNRLANELDLHSCWRALHPDLPLAQTLRWTGNREAPYHCDGIFVQSERLRRLKSCEVLCPAGWDRCTDHNVVLAKFNEPNTRKRVS